MKVLEQILADWLSMVDSLPQVYLVGGVVRDHLMGRSWKDIDIMCKNAEQLARRISRMKNATVISFEKKSDEPCYRVIDLDHRDNFIDVAEMRGQTVDEDLNRRDFTINAIAIQIHENGKLGEIIDPLNGYQDIQERIIRVTGSKAFISDPLRLLRAFRFAAELGFEIHLSTQHEIRMLAHLICQSSSERISYELIQIFNSQNVYETIQLMDQLNVLPHIFPEIESMKSCPQNAFHHLNVWNHSMLVLKNCEQIIRNLAGYFNGVAETIRDYLSKNNRIPLLYLSAMLHDVGKPQTKQYNSEIDRITFYGHEKKGESIVTEIGNRLKLSVKDQEFIRNLVAEHMHILRLSGPNVKKNTQRKLIRKMKDDFIPLLILGMADTMATLGPESKENHRIHHIEWSKNIAIEYYDSIKKIMENPNLINGQDLMRLGIPPGPDMGKIIYQIRSAQDEGLVQNRQQAISLAKQLIKDYK